MIAQNSATQIPPVFGGLVSQDGQTIEELSAAAPLLVVFLRHLGCAFCRETLADLQEVRPHLAEVGVGLALVHMTHDATAAAVLRGYGLEDVSRFSDEERQAYRAMELGSLPLRKVFGSQIWRRAYKAAVRNGHGFKPAFGNVLQLPGVFVVDQGQIVAGSAHVEVSDRPDYRRLVTERAFAVA